MNLTPDVARAWPVLAPVLLAFTGAARGQCTTAWVPGPPMDGVYQKSVLAIVEWDPDGAGPRTPVVVLGGGLTVAGNVPANRIVAFDRATGTWSAFGSGLNGVVNALAVLPTGDLVAAGKFTTAGGVPANNIARWDGAAWTPLGSGTNDEVRRLCILPNGELVAGGLFTAAGGVAASMLARWNGIAWASLGAGAATAATDRVLALHALPGGDLVAGGRLTLTGTSTAVPAARWNGATWSPMGTGTWSAVAFATLQDGDLVATNRTGPYAWDHVVRWTGSWWVPVSRYAHAGPFIHGPPAGSALCTLANGDLVTGASGAIVSWDGMAWSQIGSGANRVDVATGLSDGTLLIGGELDIVEGVAAAGVAAWNGTTWSPLDPSFGVPAFTNSAVALPNGDIVVSGWSAVPGGGRVMKWDGSSWSQLGMFSYYVMCVAAAANGDVVAGGWFQSLTGGISLAGIARWDGSSWQPLGAGVSGGPVTILLALPNGGLIAGGGFTHAGGVPANGIARWNGTAWSPLGAGSSVYPTALTFAANGDLLAGADGVKRWNGTTWSAIGGLGGGVHAIAELPNGDILAGGHDLHVGSALMHGLARWNGSTWQPFGGTLTPVPGLPLGTITGITVLPAGDVVVCGGFTAIGGVSAYCIARWNGTVWSPLATTGTGTPFGLTRMANGGLLMAGAYSMDETVSAGFAHLTTTCPATAHATGAGCLGQTLAATNLPWTGSTFRAQASGLPANAIALDVLGLSSASIPLPLVLPQGVAGCSLAVTPDAVGTVLPLGGGAATQLAIPNTAALAGAVVHEQLLALGLGTGGTIATVTGTNRLTLTIGTF